MEDAADGRRMPGEREGLRGMQGRKSDDADTAVVFSLRVGASWHHNGDVSICSRGQQVSWTTTSCIRRSASRRKQEVRMNLRKEAWGMI